MGASCLLRMNVGCGCTPTHGWLNFDNSFSVHLAKHPLLSTVLFRLRLIPSASYDFIRLARQTGIRWADASRRIPVPDNSAEVIYSSHMLEHLDRTEARQFLREAYRVLCPGGILRLVVPDLRQMVEDYLRHGDADAFIQATYLTRDKPKSWLEKIR